MFSASAWIGGAADLFKREGFRLRRIVGKRCKRKEVAQMAWERGYYYRVRKVNGRVVREYCGNGRLAQLAAAQDERERSQRESRRVAERQDREEMEALDAKVNAVHEIADLFAQAALIVAGYRQHQRGQWRRRRGISDED
jgi:hypothetical protein